MQNPGNSAYPPQYPQAYGQYPPAANQPNMHGYPGAGGGQPPLYGGGYGGYNNGYGGYNAPPPGGNYAAAPPVAAPQGGVGGWGGGGGAYDTYGYDGGVSPQGGGIPPEKLLGPDIEVSVRHAFIRKVYSLLFVQLLITFGIASIFGFVTPASQWLVRNSWLSIIGMVVALSTICAMSCFPDALARKFPVNMMLLTVVAISMSLMVGLGAAAVSNVIFLSALATTAAVVLALTLFAFQTRWDFTGCGPFVMVTAVVLMLFGIVNIFIRNRVVHLIYSCLGALVFSFYLVYDTQQIVGGRHHKFEYSIDDYVFAVLTLFLDIINLFMHILSIFSAATEDR